MVGPATSIHPTTDSRSEAIPGLLGLRAVMGTWVVADHLHDWMITLLPALAPLRPLLSGGIALDTFFILSGFVIAHVYARRLASPDRRSYGAFLRARIARLWPTHVFALAVSAVLAPVFLSHGFGVAFDVTVGGFLGNLAMLQAVPGVVPWNGPSWSVSTEMGAYLVFPVAAVIAVRARRSVALALAAAVVTVQALVLPHLYSGSPTALLLGLVWVRPVGEFALGLVLWAAWRHGIRRHWGWDVVAAAAFAGVVLLAYSGLPGPLRLLAVALLGALVVAVTGATAPVGRLLAVRPVRWAGRTSYSRYLMHLPVLFATLLVVPVDTVASAPLPVRLTVVVAWFVLVFAVGGLTHRFVEEPARRRLRGVGRRGRRSETERRPADDGQTPAGTLTPS